jgi:CelD/BcsL family acetyltransferase involved in cellulose biosynthesis
MSAAKVTLSSRTAGQAPDAVSALSRALRAVEPEPPLVFECLDKMTDIESDWRALDADPLNSLHQSYDWCAAWLAAHNNPFFIICGRKGKRTVFILPLEIVLIKSVKVAQFPGGSFNNINTAVFDHDFALSAEATTARLIADEIGTLLAGKADIVSLQNVPRVWRGRQNPLAPLASVENQNHAFQLPLLETFEATLSQINAKRRRKKFRVQTRRIEEIGGYEHVIAATADEKSALLDRFFQQKADRFAAHKIPDVFLEQPVRNFFRALLDVPRSESDTLLELHAIRLQGQHAGTIAAIAGLSRKGDHIICQFGSIDDNAAPEASPGELLFWLMIEKSWREKARLFDFGLGDQGYKRSWCPVETVQHDIFLPLTLKGRIATLLFIISARAKAKIKANPKLYATIQSLRRTSA